jgi:hypothetical protein
MASEHQQRGSVKDPEHDGRLKENREAGNTKGTTPGSRQRAEEHGKEPAEGSHSRGSHSESRHESGSHGSSHQGSGGQHSESASSRGSDDLKSREYKDEKGEVHHHTKSYMDQHKGER